MLCEGSSSLHLSTPALRVWWTRVEQRVGSAPWSPFWGSTLRGVPRPPGADASQLCTTAHCVLFLLSMPPISGLFSWSSRSKPPVRIRFVPPKPVRLEQREEGVGRSLVLLKIYRAQCPLPPTVPSRPYEGLPELVRQLWSPPF